MNPDDFEKRLQRQPLRQTPSAWREEILARAGAAADSNRRTRAVREFTFAVTTFRALRSTLGHQLSTLLQPSPQAWAALAGVWVVILAINFSLRDKPKTVAQESASPSPQVIAVLQQQKRLLTELIGQSSALEAGSQKPLLPRPRSERRVVVHFAAFGGASVLASRLVSSLAPPNCTTTERRNELLMV
jgi:hypothetical protein